MLKIAIRAKFFSTEIHESPAFVLSSPLVSPKSSYRKRQQQREDDESGKCFAHYWPLVRWILRLPWILSTKGQWCDAWILSLMVILANG